jgi:hypothetical protein
MDRNVLFMGVTGRMFYRFRRLPKRLFILVDILRYFPESCEHILSDLFCIGFEVFTAVTVKYSLLWCNLVWSGRSSLKILLTVSPRKSGLIERGLSRLKDNPD